MRNLAFACATLNFAVAFSLCSAIASADVNAPVDSAELTKNATTSAKRMETEGAAWSTLIEVRQGGEIKVDRMVRGGNLFWRVFMVAGDQTQEMTEVVEKAGIWYVTQDGRHEKYRRREAALSGVNPYVWMSMSKPVFYDGDGNPTLSRNADGAITARIPLPEDQRQQITALVQQLQQLMAVNPDKVSHELKQTFAQLQELAANGVEQRIDPQTGLITFTSSAKFNITTHGFRFLTATDEKAFLLTDSDYTDKTSRLLDDKFDVMMIGNSATWRPGDHLGDMDLMLLDSKTGEYRRIPYEGPVAAAGCFTEDRQSVFVTGVNFGNGAMTLVKINLKTGENQPLSGKLSSHGINMFPHLSPDGKYLCFMHKEVGSNLIESRIAVVDLATHDERTVGEAADYGPAMWTQGNLLVFPLREKADLSDPVQANKVAASTICTMDLTGKLTKVVRGNMVEVVSEGKTLLFDDDENWKLCDLDGKNQRAFGDGLPRHGFPEVSPDGKCVLMMQYTEGKTPAPVIVNLSDATEKAITTGPGFWGMAGWK